MTHIRRFEPADWPALRLILQTTFDAGDTYAYAPGGTDEELHRLWIELPQAIYVAVSDDGTLLGTYHLKPNQPGLGSHVCNCGYVVAPQARGRGVAAQLCEHSQAEAVATGFRAMQFNLVVSTNDGAIRLWQRLGFRIVGTLPGAFRHRDKGFVDAHVMFKTLTD